MDFKQTRIHIDKDEWDDKDYKRYDKNIDSAIDMILPWGADYEVHENEYEEDE